MIKLSVGRSSTLDLVQRKELSSVTRIKCRSELDIGPSITQSAVECNSTLDQ
jgi:hypothetical protein